MSTLPEQETPEAAAKRRPSPWMWISLALALVAIGLLVWGLNTKSDLDSANKQVDKLETQKTAGAATGTAVAASYKSAYNDLQDQVGSTSVDLADSQQQVKDAQDAAAKADDDAAAAKDQAGKAKDETEKAQAETKQAQAEADAAEAQAKLVTECATSYLTAIGKLFQSDDPATEADAVKEQLQGITADCKKALGTS